METFNVYEQLQNARQDTTAGISIASLAGDDSFRIYVAEIPPGDSVNEHLHEKGIELYYIETGEGTMYTTLSKKSRITTPVKKGDTFKIEPGQAHQLVNTGSTPLRLLFVCPATHLSTDRIVITK
jgi:mannose-6-phosphate isomerase-like protein (cupin superfamily)